MDNTNNTFQVKKKIFLQGNFIGKYEANEYAVIIIVTYLNSYSRR